MPLLQAREILQFQDNPDNATDTVINGIHFNKTALTHYNYTLYNNGTLSNDSNCWLSFEIYKPRMFSNGTFINSTSCYTPIEGVKSRGSGGIAFASIFALTIMFSLINLRKHGKKFLPVEKRWKPIGRRWQWYWMIFLAACGTISCFMSIDVDRDYLQSSAIIFQSFFYHLMLPIGLAGLWEAVRHWGSWQERQICDRDIFAFGTQTTRETQEFYLPLIFYLFGFLVFFMTIPRSWTSIQKQRSVDQTLAMAKPAATDGRFKAASFLAVICLLIICYSLIHSVYRYKQRPASPLGRAFFYLIASPSKYTIAIILAGIRVGFNVASSFSWNISPLNQDVESGYLYGLGYAPLLLIIVVLNVYGYIDPNEDQALIKERVDRGHVVDAELGIEPGKRKPKWWRRLRPDFQQVSPNDPHSSLRALATEIGGGRPTQQNMERYLEMGNMEYGQKDHADKKDMGVDDKPVDPFSDQASESINSHTMLRDTPRTERLPSYASNETTSSQNTRASQAPSQKVRSMLDV